MLVAILRERAFTAPVAFWTHDKCAFTLSRNLAAAAAVLITVFRSKVLQHQIVDMLRSRGQMNNDFFTSDAPGFTVRLCDSKRLKT